MRGEFMETPFEKYKATELNSETLESCFVKPKHIYKMYDNSVAFIIGQRGTGKTTLLKHLCQEYNTSINIKNKKLGIYYRFDVNKMRSFSGESISDEGWDTLFAHSFSIDICKLLTSLLITLRPSHPLEKESYICNRIKDLFFEDLDIDTSNLEGLLDYLNKIDIIARKYKRNPLKFEKPLIGECEKTFEEFCYMISKEKSYKGVCVHFLFDEYENMLDYQKEFINSCAKNATDYYTYKICVRPYGMNDMKTRNSQEVLNEADDYKLVNYIEDIIGDPKEVADFMRNACATRLRNYYDDKEIIYHEDDLIIDNYFPKKQSDDQLFEKISKNTDFIYKTKKTVEKIFKNYNRKYSYDWNIMQLKLFIALSQKRDFDIDFVSESINNKNKKYVSWCNNYKKSILFMCFSELNKQYEMSGFEDIITISGNIVRYVLEICDYCFLCTNLAPDGKFSAVNEKMQTEAIYKVSQRRFLQISTIPIMGQEIKQMTLAIGMIFNMYHKDQRIKRFEPNHFSILRNNTSIKKYNDSKIKEALELSVKYGVFESERSTKDRSGSDVPIENEDFHLHPILTPYFKISWRKKQKCRFTLDEMNGFLFGNDQDVSKLLSKYLTKIRIDNFDNSQLSFENLKQEYFYTE